MLPIIDTRSFGEITLRAASHYASRFADAFEGGRVPICRHLVGGALRVRSSGCRRVAEQAVDLAGAARQARAV